MLIVILSSTDPYFNLATEEYLLKSKEEDIFMLWQNEKSIIIGKSQNTLAEINYDKVKERSVNVVRRLSGGGAVYHDLGNLNYTFITNSGKEDFLNFEKFSRPIIDALATLGITASLSGRNDLLIGERKFSGNAQYVYKNRILHHGTLLFDTDLEALGELLNVKEEKIKSKGIQSVRSRVTNIIEYLSQKNFTITDFKNTITTHVLTTFPDAEIYKLSENDISAISKLADSVYNTWEWNFGSSPKYTFNKTTKTSSGLIEISLEIKEGIIEAATIHGDFFSYHDVSELEKALCGIKHNETSLTEFYDKHDILLFLGNITKTEFISCFL